MTASREGMRLGRERASEIFNGEPVLVTAADESRAGGSAERAVCVAVGEPDSGFGDPVDVGGGNVFAAVAADVGVTHVIGEDEDDVGFRGRVERCDRQEEGANESEGFEHRKMERGGAGSDGGHQRQSLGEPGRQPTNPGKQGLLRGKLGPD
jgi:hypothetical protein